MKEGVKGQFKEKGRLQLKRRAEFDEADEEADTRRKLKSLKLNAMDEGEDRVRR